MANDIDGLPASVRAAWGLREKPAKGPKPGLSLDRIVAAGVTIARTEGLAAVSMSKVAAEVGVTAMALYRYVGNKDELLTLMVDAAIGAPPEVPRPGQGWREGLTEWAWAENAAYRRHQWALRVPIQGIPVLPNQTAWLDRGLRCLGADQFAADGHLEEEDKLSIILLISNLVRVYAMLESDLSAARQTSQVDPDQTMAEVTRTFNRLIDHQRFPALSAVLASGVPAKADPVDPADPVDKEFSFGLERALDGIAILIPRAKR
jgi:AcrR family transcriptional regulator